MGSGTRIAAAPFRVIGVIERDRTEMHGMDHDDGIVVLISTVRRAVGPRSRDILIQFFMEASHLVVGGWATGLALAAGVAAVMALATTGTRDVPVGALLGSLAMALELGLEFGAVSTRSAARIPPILTLLDR